MFHDYTKEAILVICYTNHALDQFLEELLDIGIPPDGIVRLGSKSTPRTASLNIFDQKSSYKRSQSAWEIINQLKTQAEDIQRCLTTEFKSYNTYSVTWKDILAHLEFPEEDAHFYEALSTPQPENGMIRIEKRGKRVGTNISSAVGRRVRMRESSKTKCCKSTKGFGKWTPLHDELAWTDGHMPCIRSK